MKAMQNRLENRFFGIDWERDWPGEIFVLATFIRSGTELNQILSHMGQFHKAIFIGRDSPDTGIDEYRHLAKKLKITLDVFTNRPNAAELLPQYDIAFVSRYLAILEALAVGIPVLAHYNNAIKKDYLLMAPFARFIKTFNDHDKVELNFSQKQITDGQKWAKTQTWAKLADMYEKLWQKWVLLAIGQP